MRNKGSGEAEDDLVGWDGIKGIRVSQCTGLGASVIKDRNVEVRIELREV